MWKCTITESPQYKHPAQSIRIQRIGTRLFTADNWCHSGALFYSGKYSYLSSTVRLFLEAPWSTNQASPFTRTLHKPGRAAAVARRGRGRTRRRGRTVSSCCDGTQTKRLHKSLSANLPVMDWARLVLWRRLIKARGGKCNLSTFIIFQNPPITFSSTFEMRTCSCRPTVTRGLRAEIRIFTVIWHIIMTVLIEPPLPLKDISSQSDRHSYLAFIRLSVSASSGVLVTHSSSPPALPPN